MFWKGLTMRLLQVIMRMNLEFVIVYSYIHSINNRYYSKMSKMQNIGLLFLSLTSCMIAEMFTPFIGLASYIFLVIPLSIIQRVVLNHTYKLIFISNLIIVCSNLFIKMCSSLFTKLLMMFTKNISENGMFFTNTILSFILNSFVCFILLKIILSKDERFSEVVNKLEKKEIAFILSLVMILAIPNLIIYIYNLHINNTLLLVINIFSILVSIVVIISLLLKEKQYTYTEFDLEQEKLYNQTLRETIDSLRILKHDYNNILQSINGYIITKQYDSLDAHIKELINNTTDLSSLECISPNVINQPAIYGIITAKYIKAKNKKINFKLEVFEDISSISFNATKLSRILGILLDNAIEAAEKSSNPMVEVKFIYNPIDNTHSIKIKNTYEKGKVIDTDKIFEKGVSSKRKKSGLGLWEVKKILSGVDNVHIYTNLLDNYKLEQVLVC